MRRQIEKMLLYLLTKRYARVATHVEFIKKYSIIGGVALTQKEKKAVIDIWGCLGEKIDFRYFEFYKALGIFDPKMVPDDLYLGYIIRTLNPLKFSKCLQNKGFYSILFPEIRQPKNILNSINGEWIDGKGNILKKTDNITYLFHNVHEFIIKPSSENCGGDGVKKYVVSKGIDLQSLFLNIKGDFVCQYIVNQCKETALFNEKSLNTFRINTININGVVTVENMIFRHGINGASVDNGAAGGICIGVKPNGQLTDWGYDARMHKFEKSSNGIPYKSVRFMFLDRAVKMVIQWHLKYFISMGQVAWDVAVDDCYNVVMVEVNLGWPGVILEQVVNGKPLFGERTSEVVRYVAENKINLSWTDFLKNWN